MNTAAPLEIIPLFVKAGSIIPMGKSVQYTGQYPADTLEIRIYTGADGKFELYEDEGDTYNYEKGKYSIIDFQWNESAHALTIGNRRGDFPGKLKTKIFQVVVVSPEHGTGVSVAEQGNKTAVYDGKKKTITF